MLPDLTTHTICTRATTSMWTPAIVPTPSRCHAVLASASAAQSVPARPRWSPRFAARLSAELELAVVTNDIYTTEDADFLLRHGVLPRRAGARSRDRLLPAHRDPR